MALIEKITRKIEIDEAKGSHISIRETTHMVDDSTGEIIYPGVKHHRKVVITGDDAMAVSEGLTQTANEHWTPEVRQAEDDRQAATTATSPEKGAEPPV